MGDAQLLAAEGRPAAVRMAVVRGSYRSLTMLWPQVGPTERYSLGKHQRLLKKAIDRSPSAPAKRAHAKRESMVAPDVRVVAEIERRLLASPSVEGIALRYGFFYGPGTWFNPDGDVAEQVRRQQLPIIDNGEGVWTWLHVEDAAAATVAAAERGNRGIYLITDGQPLAARTWLPAFAAWADTPPPPRLSSEEAQVADGDDAVYYGTQLRGASNVKAKRELQFQPRPLEWISPVAGH